MCRLNGDPRDTVGNMNRGAGKWLNIFATLTFREDTLVRGVEFYAKFTGRVYVSFWRKSDKGSHWWTLIGKILLDVVDNTPGVKVIVLLI